MTEIKRSFPARQITEQRPALRGAVMHAHMAKIMRTPQIIPFSEVVKEPQVHQPETLFHGMPFDTTKTGIPFYDMMLKNPDYFLKNKGLKGNIVYMSPDEYIALAAKCLGSTPERFARVVDEEFIRRYANSMWMGTKFDMPVIECHRGYTEGRHRALAAKKIGVKQMPVFIVEKATDLPTYQPTNQHAVHEAAPKTVFKRAGKLEIHPLLVQAFGITPEEIVETINASEEPEAMRDMFVFLSDYAALSDPRTRLSVSGDKLDFMVADLKRRMAHVAEFYREQAIEYGKLVRFMEHVKVRKLQMADRLQRISEEARKLSAFSGQTRTDKIAFIDAVVHLEHTSGSVIPIAFGISDYGREDYWPRKLLAYLRTHGMPGMVRESFTPSNSTKINWNLNIHDGKIVYMPPEEYMERGDDGKTV